MDGDIFGDTLVDDLLALTGVGGDFDTSDLMNILEPDYLENNILLNDTGSLSSLGDATAFDDLNNFSDAPISGGNVPASDVHASVDGVLSAHEEADNNHANANGDPSDAILTDGAQPTSSAANRTTPSLKTPNRTTPSLITQASQAPANDAPADEQETPIDPLEDLTGMLPQDDLEALARLAAGEDEYPDSTAASGLGAVSPLENNAPLNTSGNMSNSGSMSANVEHIESEIGASGKDLLDDTLDERFGPSLDELEELALLASGGTDLGSVVMPEDDEDEEEHDSQDHNSQDTVSNSQATNASAPASPSQPRQASQQNVQPDSRQDSQQNVQPDSRQPTTQQTAPAPTPPQTQTSPQAPPQAPRRFSQAASTWSDTPSSNIWADTDANNRPLLSTQRSSADLVTPNNTLQQYRPPNQLRRYFNAGIMLEAANRLKDVLDIPDIPVVVFLGRAAERCLEHLPEHDNVTVAHLAGNGFVPSFQVPRQESFRRVLLAKDRAENDSSAEQVNNAEQISSAEQGSSQQGVLVADISELELDDLSVALEGTHLLLTRLQTDPVSHELTGTLTLVGNVDLRSGANFLRAIKEALESPITLMV